MSFITSQTHSNLLTIIEEDVSFDIELNGWYMCNSKPNICFWFQIWNKI